MNNRNLDTYIDYIKEVVEPGDSLRIDWVLLMLEDLKTDNIINPAYLRAKYVISFDGNRPERPTMFLTDETPSPKRSV